MKLSNDDFLMEQEDEARSSEMISVLGILLFVVGLALVVYYFGFRAAQ
jgi:hypothetical protein